MLPSKASLLLHGKILQSHDSLIVGHTGLSLVTLHFATRIYGDSELRGRLRSWLTVQRHLLCDVRIVAHWMPLLTRDSVEQSITQEQWAY